MANAYSQIYIQYVFAVKGRECLLRSNDKILQGFIREIVKNRKSEVLAINNMPDHIHILISQHPSYSVSKMAQAIKSNSSRMINEERRFPHKFSWQRGYAAFSYSKSQIETVKRYILNQQKHHKYHTFQSEYIKLRENCGEV